MHAGVHEMVGMRPAVTVTATGAVHGSSCCGRNGSSSPHPAPAKSRATSSDERTNGFMIKRLLLVV